MVLGESLRSVLSAVVCRNDGGPIDELPLKDDSEPAEPDEYEDSLPVLPPGPEWEPPSELSDERGLAA